MEELLNSLPQIGRVEYISIRPERKAPVDYVPEVEAMPGKGLKGDHYQGKSGKREVTLIQFEHLQAVGKMLGRTAIEPGLTRRNIVVSGINLLAFADRQFRIGEAVLEMTGHCHPCSRMEENLGPGGYNAMRGHGGITARIVQGGTIHVGDEVKLA
ncbi:MAG: MOSC domain-containing protein [Saprospiraceae bacterium]